MQSIWPFIFSINIAQCLFLVSLILIKGSRNTFASRLLIVLLVLLCMNNIGDLTTSTGLAVIVPELFVLSFGAMWVFGPLFYLYARAIADPNFKWRHVYWLHFLPYAYQVGVNAWMMIAFDHDFWLMFVRYFQDGQLSMRLQEKVSVGIQIVQLAIYLVLTLRWVKEFKQTMGSAQYIVSMTHRVKWLRVFAISFFVFLLQVTVFYILVWVRGHHEPTSSYAYTLVTSVIIFMLAYKLVLSPELLSPGFEQKYRAYMQFEGDEGTRYIEKMHELMQTRRMFVDPDLSLSMFAEQLDLPAHQVSKLVNEKFGKSFTDMVNEYRVEEFISKMNDPKYKAYSLYGIALEVGFSSKSAFNSAFKKIKGKTPSEFKL